MAIYAKRPSLFNAMNIAICPTVYEFAGDVIENQLEQPLSDDTMLAKVLLFKGSLIIRYPGTDEQPRTTGLLFPEATDMGKTVFHTTALEDNTEQVAIRAISLDCRIIHVVKELAAGDHVEIQKGVILVVFGNNYTVNSNVKTSNQLFAVEQNDAGIQAIEPCTLYVFKAILI